MGKTRSLVASPGCHGRTGNVLCDPVSYLCLISGIARYNVQHSPIYLAAMITINILGNFLHFTSDMQKAVSLELRPGQLITDKLFAICRHPNYLGESLIYGSFVGLGDSWLMAGYLITYVVAYWWPNIYWKEKSMSRYESWKAYCMETALLVPFVW